MRAAFFAASDQDLADPFFSHRLRWRTGAALRTLLADDPADFDPVAELADRLPPEFGRWDPLTRAQHLEAAILLPGYLLGAQGDRMAMAHGVEARFPFLDPDLVAFAGSLPPRLRLHGTTEKWLLRRLARDLLPDAITSRPKRPYRAPDVTAFFAADGEPLAGWVAELLAPDAIRRAGLFDAAAVARLVTKLRAQPAQAGTKDSMALVAVLSAQLLHCQLVERQPVA
jgi:asparagine synthase (glutamine-hydrolysing)